METTSDHVAARSSVASVKPKSRFAFSLRFWIGACLLLSIAAGWIVTLREVRALRAENKEYKTRLGILEVDDPAKIHVLFVREREDRIWRWKVYLPPGEAFQFGVHAGPNQGDVVPIGKRILMDPKPTGQIYNVEVKVRPNASGKWQAALFVDDLVTHWAVTDDIVDPAATWMHGSGWIGSNDSYFRPLTYAAKQRVVLQRIDQSSVSPSPMPVPGLEVWVGLQAKKK